MDNDLLTHWQSEKRSVYLYRLIADTEAGSPRQALFLNLADAAERQAAFWADAAASNGVSVPHTYRPDIRTLLVGCLVRYFGAYRMRTALSAMKVRGMSIYVAPAPSHPMPITANEAEKTHNRLGGGGNLRAAVFGINDGLLSNASLIMGMAGASPDSRTLVLTGIAGLLAGAFAMASGEYVSVRSQRELHEYQINLERAELAEYPQEEAAELALIYEAKGIEREQAHILANTIVSDPDKALDTLAKEELGLDPAALDSPWGAALSSFLAFSIGAVVPLLPFLFGAGFRSLPIAATLTAASLLGVGAMLSLFTGQSAIKGGGRMLLIGLGAMVATYLIGKTIGVSLS